ncbi:hypothetical protein P43SY_002803 [Pythium insidiosum]|uniref:Peroxin/Ferlin domain-containing protein n=1 Tax=Pythium insidiosum TaxID=114742 RepID=A0AAD5M8Y1_PYTIN|nr:hypothetical protein P43SY_002803 [Pythium insidiosum]
MRWTAERDVDPAYRAFHARLTAFFWAHDPRQVASIDALLAKHKVSEADALIIGYIHPLTPWRLPVTPQGEEEELIQRVHREFGVRDFSGDVATDDLYEHERYSYLSFSWGSSFPGHLLPTDRRRWSGIHGAPSAQHREKVEPQLPVGWRWTSDWAIDKETSNCDADGWIYAFDFTMLNFMVKRNGGRNAPKSTDYVRRRRWIRHRTRLPPPTAQAAKEKPADAVDNQDDLTIPDALDVDDDEGDDPGDEEEDEEKLVADEEELRVDGDGSRPGTLRKTSSRRPSPPISLPSTLPSESKAPEKTSHHVETATLQHFSLTMEKAALDAAWAMAVKNLETIYTQAKSHHALRKKRWSVKKEKIRQQMNLLEKTIASMQSFVHDEQLKRRHSSSQLSAMRDSKTPSSKSAVRMPLSPGAGATASRVSSSDTSGINLASKLQCAQSKLDALKRMYWHPREKQYTLRFSIDGIFYGLRDFLIESLVGTFAMHVSHQTNGAQGVTPTCKVQLKGHTVARGRHVKVVGERGTIVPKTIWDLMHVDTDFDATVMLIYVEDIADERNPWLEGKAIGRWEFLFGPDATRVDLANFSRRTKGGVDLPEPVVRKLMSDVLSSLLRDLALLYFPTELAVAFEKPPARLDIEGEINVTGPSIENVMDREIELTVNLAPLGSHSASASASPSPSPSPSPSLSPSPISTASTASPSPMVTPRSPAVAAPFAAVAAVASATVSLLTGGDTDEHMRQIAALLELTPAQLNLLVALRHCGLFPASHSFKSVTALCEYYNAFFLAELSDGATDHIQTLRTTWTQLLELLFIRKMKARAVADAAAIVAAAAGTPTPPAAPAPAASKAKSSAALLQSADHKYELFDMNKLWDRVHALTKKPVRLELRVTRLNCTADAMHVVDAMAQMYERLVLGIDYSKPRVGAEQLIYGFRFGRKPTVSLAAAHATHSQSTQLLDPTIHLQMDASFRTRLKAFSQICRALKGLVDIAKHNLKRVSVEVAGKIRGTGDDCVMSGSFRDLDFVGPVNLSLHVPAMFLGQYRMQTVPLEGDDDRVALQLELLVPPSMRPAVRKAVAARRHQRKPVKAHADEGDDDDVLLRATLADVAMEVLLDVDALVEQHRARSHSSATEMTAPWAPSATFARQVEHATKHDKHTALSVAVHSRTGQADVDEMERAGPVVRIPSPTSRPGEPYGKIRLATSDLTELHVRAKSGTFSTHASLLVHVLIDHLRPLFLASFPEHQVLFDRVQSCLLRWLQSPSMATEFQVLVKAFLHGDSQELFFTACGSPAHPTPVTYHDEVAMLDVVLQVDDLVNIWIDDRYPPYASPLYF